MTTDATQWARVKAIVGEAADLPAGERDSFVEARCAGDESLRSEVRSLLAAAARSDALLHPAADAWVGVLGGGAPDADPGPGHVLGNFVIERVIASAPGSIVYAARQREPDRPVALKVFRGLLPLDTDSPRFRQEAQAASRVEHPNVVRVYEAGRLELAPGQRVAYIAMELVDGVPITRHVASSPRSVAEIVGLLRRVAAGVSRIHQCGVIHRDLKPSNVLVDREGEPRILDFGIARLDPLPGRTWRTLDGALLGTPGYISPEQIRHPDLVDARADIWALGVLAYELLAGVSPFPAEGRSALESIRDVLHVDPAPLRRLAPRVPVDLERVVMKALARRPEDRYDSAAEFSADLANVLEHRPVVARGPSAWYRASRFARRHRGVLALAGVGVLVLAGFAGSQVRAWRRAAVERDRAVAVTDLLRNMISAASPHFGHREVRMRDVLAGMEADLAQQLPDQPLVEADVRALLGRLAFALGEYERSRTHLERAIALRSAADAGASREAISDRAALAQSLRWLYELDDATAIANAARDDAVARFGPDDPATLDAREALAGCWHDAQRLDDAEREYRAILAARAARQGARAAATIDTRSNLASLLAELGRYAESERELAAVVGARAGADTISARANLAQVIGEQGRLDEAVAMLTDLERHAADALGSTHPTTLVVHTNLIEFVRRQGDERRAGDLSREHLQRCIAAHGWSHDLTINSLTGYVSSLLRAGRADDALDVAARAARESEPHLAPDDARLHRLTTTLAGALAAVGRHDEADAAYARAIAGLAAALGPGHRQTLGARNNHAVARIERGDAAAAVPDLADALAMAEADGYAEMTPVLRRNLGKALLRAGDSARGVPTLEDAYAESVRRQELANARVCAGLLAEHFERAGDEPAAARWRALAQGS